MSDERFVVPEPSAGATKAAYRAWKDCGIGGEPWAAMLRRGYEWDVERIVRAEVAAFVQYVITHPKYLSGCMLLECHNEWYAARFGEGEPEKLLADWDGTVAAPEKGCDCFDSPPVDGNDLGHRWGCPLGRLPTPSAPAGGFRTEPHIGHTEHGDRVYGLADNPVFTPAERDFLRAFALLIANPETGVPGERHRAYVAAARRVVEDQ